MSPQRSLTKPIGRLSKNNLNNEFAEVEQMLAAVEKQKAALLAEIAQRDSKPDLSKANPDEYRLEWQRAERAARNKHKRLCDFKVPAICQEFQAGEISSIYEAICKILDLDYLAADTNALQCKLMWYACELACYEQDRDKCIDYVKCTLDESNIDPFDLPGDISGWINMVVFNIA